MPIRRRVAIAILILGTSMVLAVPRPAPAKSCIKWQRAMAEGRISLMPEGKTVLVKRFDDFTKVKGDEWLSYGLRDYVSDVLGSAERARVFAGITEKYGSGPYEFMVDGTYQHLGEALRIFVRLKDGGSGKLIAQKELLFPYPDNKEFFTKLARAAAELMGLMKLKYEQHIFDAVQNATSSTKAYESYAKGRHLFETYALSKFKEAKRYFNETKRIDYRSPLGYQGIAALDNFLGLYYKQRGKPYSTYYQKAQAELTTMAKLTKPASPVFGYVKYKPAKKYSGPGKLKNRFLLGYAAYIEGQAAQKGGDLEAAANSFRKSAELVPEDAMAWYRLARAESMQGRLDEAAKAQAKAHAVNPCLGQ